MSHEKPHFIGHRLRRRLGRIITENCEVFEMEKSERQQQIPHILNDVEEMCYDAGSLRGSIVKMFGSSVAGLSLPSSDVDILIQLPEDGTQLAFDDALHGLKNSRKFKLLNYVRKTKVPVITVTHKMTNINCDLTFSSPTLKRDDVLQNTELLRKYAENCTAFKKLFLFVKTIFGEFKVFSAKNRGLSSYAHSIILLFYLINRKKCVFIDPLTYSLTVQKQYIGPLVDILYDYLIFIRDELEYEIIDIYKIGASSGFEREDLIIIDPYLRKKDLARNLSNSNLKLLQSMANEWIHYILGLNDKMVTLNIINENIDYIYSKSVSRANS